MMMATLIGMSRKRVWKAMRCNPKKISKSGRIATHTKSSTHLGFFTMARHTSPAMAMCASSVGMVSVLV